MSEKIPSWLLPLAVWLGVLAWVLRPIWDIDIWWHIALGRSILEHGLPTRDILSAAHPENMWNTFQSGYEVLVGSLDELGGLGLVRLIHAAAVATGFALVAVTVRRVCFSGWVALAVVALTLVLYEDRIRVRPHVFHFLFIAVMLHRMVRSNESWRWPELLWLAPLMMIWGAFHAPGSLWGVALMGAVWIYSPRHREAWAVPAVASVAMVSVPGYLEGILGAFRVHTVAGMQARFVPEHWALWDYPNAGLGAHAWLVIGAVVFCLLLFGRALYSTWQQRHELAWQSWVPEAITALIFGIFSVLMARFAWYAVVPLIFAMRWIRLPQRTSMGLWIVLALLWIADAVLYVGPRYVGIDRWLTDVHRNQFPEAAATFLEKSGIHGRIYNEIGWGGYLLYRLHPDSTVLFDGRIAFDEEVAQLVLDEDDKESEVRRAVRSGSKSLVAGALARARIRSGLFDQARRDWGVDLIVRRAPVFGAIPHQPANWERIYNDRLTEIWAARDAKLERRKVRAHIAPPDPL